MIILLIVFLLVLAAVEYYSRRHGLERIFYDVQTSRSLLEPDEEFTIHSTIENHKFWFVPYVSMSENFPLGIHVPGEEKICPKRSSVYRCMPIRLPHPLSS